MSCSNFSADMSHLVTLVRQIGHVMITTTPISHVDGHHPTTPCMSTAVRPTPAATNANADADANNNNSCRRQRRQRRQLLPSANPNDNERACVQRYAHIFLLFFVILIGPMITGFAVRVKAKKVSQQPLPTPSPSLEMRADWFFLLPPPLTCLPPTPLLPEMQRKGFLATICHQLCLPRVFSMQT